MKAEMTPTRQQTDRVMEKANAFFTRWMEINWSITFVTVCRSLGLGKERAKRLFEDIRLEMKRHDEYENYEYSMRELNAELERLEIPVDFFFNHDTLKQELRAERLKEQSKKASIQESYEMAEKLKIMKELEQSNKALTGLKVDKKVEKLKSC